MDALDSVEAQDGEAPPTLPSPSRVKRTLFALTLALSALAAACFVAVVPLSGLAAIESPVLWVAVASFWGAVYCGIYLFDVRAVERALSREQGLNLRGIRVIWLPDPRARGLGANIEVWARAHAEALPLNFRLLLSVDLFGDLDVVAFSAAWSCKADGVLLLSPRASRFLEGATAESLGLPSQEEAALRGLFFPPGESKDMPNWGAPAGPRAREALAAARVEEWLFGPEQPFVAFEAFGARIEKFWSPIGTRMNDLDLASALDLLRVVRAVDRDAVEMRRGGTTSSPSSPPPSSHRP